MTWQYTTATANTVMGPNMFNVSIVESCKFVWLNTFILMGCYLCIRYLLFDIAKRSKEWSEVRWSLIQVTLYLDTFIMYDKINMA